MMDPSDLARLDQVKTNITNNNNQLILKGLIMSNSHYVSEETIAEVNVNVDGLKSFVMLTLHNENYRDGKFTITFKGDAINALMDETVQLRLAKAASMAREDRDRALAQLRGSQTPENLVTIE
jgi:hydrogenase maturation factor